tara:strand:- start:2803 stop:3441 length:639 start_codon:yes stop_codon:yes gene_type:complete
MFKKILKLFLPPIIPYLYLTLFSKKNNLLFDGDDSLFKQLAEEINIYGEYGCGLSTNWILKNTSSQVISVDSSGEWVKKVKTKNNLYEPRLIIKHIDLGKVGAWGTPISYIKSYNFQNYTDFIWEQSVKPKLVLIDGRFRVCCFLTSLKLADTGTKIIFDDYVNRPHYHFIEKYVTRIKECGRQCLFIVPPKKDIDMDSLDKDIELFRFVMN